MIMIINPFSNSILLYLFLSFLSIFPLQLYLYKCFYTLMYNVLQYVKSITSPFLALVPVDFYTSLTLTCCLLCILRIYNKIIHGDKFNSSKEQNIHIIHINTSHLLLLDRPR
ncbi:hypothetical protein BDA99DRAFT_514094 [Phascolomyces articulosus]|uniref:Uncharacterized protein n=1 Tax=Phascolomyces articulosus TaxID=60185 RepID=A0AAD5PC79_9FUNG|nr:hypothetical protein BDA99DRAFT_514094 [Phascolomyces articulosus]